MIIIINILLALTAAGYGFLTNDWWLAGAGILASVLVGDGLFLIVIVLVAIIGYSCIYHIFSTVLHYNQLEKPEEILGITASYMMVSLVRGMQAFWG